MTQERPWRGFKDQHGEFNSQYDADSGHILSLNLQVGKWSLFLDITQLLGIESLTLTDMII